MTPNDPKLSDRGVRRGTCMAGGTAAADAGAVTHGAVRCSAWLGDVGCSDSVIIVFVNSPSLVGCQIPDLRRDYGRRRAWLI